MHFAPTGVAAQPVVMPISRQQAYTNANALSTANLKTIATAAVDAYVALCELAGSKGGLHPNLTALRDAVRNLVASGDHITG